MKGSFAAGILSVLLLSGCASPRAYFADRGRDAADIFTLSLSAGLGGSVRLGPLSGGLGSITDLAALRGGTVAVYNPKREESMDVKIVCFGFEWFTSEQLRRRGKDFAAATGMLDGSAKKPVYVPFVSVPRRSKAPNPVNGSAVGQVDVAACALLGIRAGFNVAELADFLVGWTTADILGDDIGLPPPPAAAYDDPGVGDGSRSMHGGR